MLDKHSQVTPLMQLAQAVVVGTDIPDIRTQVIDDAVAALDQYEVLLASLRLPVAD